MRSYTIEENDANQRLDKFLKKLLPNASSSLVYKINRKNKVKVNRKRKDNEYKLQVGDVIQVYLLEEDFESLTKVKKVDTGWQKRNINKKNIVYEDKSLLVLNKPAKINVHPWDHKTKETNVIYMVRDYLWDKLNSLTFKPSLVHRIDRNTSGILLVAKEKSILVKLVEDFKTHDKVTKTYYAIVRWRLKKKSWTITKNLKRIENAKNTNKVQVDKNGQKAITNYKVIWEYVIQTSQWKEEITELEVQILTWRMHQIRVHLASLGHPIIGDNTYGDKVFNGFIEKKYWLSRQALHAWRIDFMHYEKNKKMHLEARLKPDLVEFIEKIRK